MKFSRQGAGLAALGVFAIFARTVQAVACTTDDQCRAITPAPSPATPRCDTSVPGGNCVQCLGSSDCPTANPSCNTNTKVCGTGACFSDAQCAAPTPKCKNAAAAGGGFCVVCVADTDCSATPATPVCAQSNRAAAGGNPAVTANTCVAGCLNDAACPLTAPKCDPVSRQCVVPSSSSSSSSSTSSTSGLLSTSSAIVPTTSGAATTSSAAGTSSAGSSSGSAAPSTTSAGSSSGSAGSSTTTPVGSASGSAVSSSASATGSLGPSANAVVSVNIANGQVTGNAVITNDNSGNAIATLVGSASLSVSGTQSPSTAFGPGIRVTFDAFVTQAARKRAVATTCRLIVTLGGTEVYNAVLFTTDGVFQTLNSQSVVSTGNTALQFRQVCTDNSVALTLANLFLVAGPLSPPTSTSTSSISTSTSSTSVSSTSVSSTSVSSTSTSSGSFTTSITSISSTTATDEFPTDFTDFPTSTDSVTSATDSATDGVTTPTASSTATPNPINVGGFTYLGCFGSPSSLPTFVLTESAQVMTVDRCIATCGPAGTRYAAIFGNDCFCGTFVDDANEVRAAEEECNIPCGGNPRQRCGGRAAILKRQLPGIISSDIRFSIYVNNAVNVSIPGVTGGGVTTVATATIGGQVTVITTVVPTGVPTGGPCANGKCGSIPCYGDDCYKVIVGYGEYCGFDYTCFGPDCQRRLVWTSGVWRPEVCNGFDCGRKVKCSTGKCEFVTKGMVEYEEKVTCYGNYCKVEKCEGDACNKKYVVADGSYGFQSCPLADAGKKYECDGDNCTEVKGCDGSCPTPAPPCEKCSVVIPQPPITTTACNGSSCSTVVISQPPITKVPYQTAQSPAQTPAQPPAGPPANGPAGGAPAGGAPAGGAPAGGAPAGSNGAPLAPAPTGAKPPVPVVTAGTSKFAINFGALVFGVIAAAVLL